VHTELEKSLQFFVTRILMKILNTRSSDIVMECQNYFGFYIIYFDQENESNVTVQVAGKLSERTVRIIQLRCA